MTPIKTLVIFMALLIIVAIGFVGYGVTRTAPHKVSSSAASVATGGNFAIDLPLAPGTKVTQMETAGDKLVLHVTGRDMDRILLVDIHSGEVTGSITLVPAAAP